MMKIQFIYYMYKKNVLHNVFDILHVAFYN